MSMLLQEFLFLVALNVAVIVVIVRSVCHRCFICVGIIAVVITAFVITAAMAIFCVLLLFFMR